MINVLEEIFRNWYIVLQSRIKDQGDCVLNDLEELGDKEFLVLMDQYNIEIFSCVLRLLPLYSSTFHPTNVEIAQDLSEDTPLISRIQSLHLLLEVDHHDEEEYSVVMTLGKRLANNLLAQHQVLVDELARVRIRGFAFAFDRLTKSKYIRFQRKILELHLGGFLLVFVVVLVVTQVYNQLILSMRNSNPRVRIVLVLQIQF